MKIYILGICGTFMAGIALLARELGIDVAGSDAEVYPPMSTQLSDAGIELHDGYAADSLPDNAGVFIIGNVITRGNPQFEYILDNNLPYISGPQWLYENVLKDRWVLAVAGTHGKTTTSSMLAWILHSSGLNPGYLIGGVGKNLIQSAQLGQGPFFIIEADEYDTALFDKRSKFVHYHPQTLILNNLEFDHADIFDDLAAIQRQFHHLIRMMPARGLIIHNSDCPALDQVIAMGCWTECLSFAAEDSTADFSINENNQLTDRNRDQQYDLELAQSGLFNSMNAAAAALAARHAGVPLPVSIESLKDFEGVKRRQEIIAEIDGVRIIDDFAHHPTAIELTLNTLKANTRGRLYAVIELRSNTMKMGIFTKSLMQSIASADEVLLCENQALQWDLHAIAETASTLLLIKPNINQVISHLVKNTQPGDQIVIMSNGGFDNLRQRLINAMQSRQ
ncbi:MAG: UDP-N-acetylmuramate:L-alanyl-gamma-D-glutamyl-meso-diaminopimelate ligase [Gammaproteobacteria bacterium]|nr:UDP-N-acetylmuramate:L-alanyl-gamma-D-glutamyl-meso-diaminopimelate ligase [Gammaproteobacteria bacterium]